MVRRGGELGRTRTVRLRAWREREAWFFSSGDWFVMVGDDFGQERKLCEDMIAVSDLRPRMENVIL